MAEDDYILHSNVRNSSVMSIAILIVREYKDVYIGRASSVMSVLHVCVRSKEEKHIPFHMLKTNFHM